MSRKCGIDDPTQARIPGSKYFRDQCAICGDSIRVSRLGYNLCESCRPDAPQPYSRWCRGDRRCETSRNSIKRGS